MAHESTDWAAEVKACESPIDLYELGLRMAAEISRLEKIEVDAKAIYEYREDALGGTFAMEQMGYVLDGLECKLFPERFRQEPK